MDLPSIKGAIKALREDKKKLVQVAVGCGSILMLIAFFAIYSRTVLAVNIGGKQLGHVKNEQIIKEIIEELQKKYHDKLGCDVEFVQAIQTEKTKALGKKVDSKEEILQKLEAALSIKVKAVGIIINDKETAVVKDKATAEAVLADVKEHYASITPGEVIKIEVAEKVKLAEKFVNPNKIIDKEDAKAIILQGSLETKTYEIQEGDTLWDIALRENITLDDLIKANPQLKSEHKLALGDEINLKEVKPLLNITVVKKVTYEEAIPYETEVVTDNSMWKWDQKVKQPGEKGTREVAAQVSYKNGVKIDHVVLGEKVVKEPVTRIVSKGTKAQVAYRGSGRFLWPTVGQITSPYGRRGREFHSGIDIATSKGTSVRAANSGTVTFAGWRGGYGNLVIINHGGGIETYYAHNSSLAVKVGQQVEKGQHIACVGSTGRSTGSHLHFEIRVNDSTVNPLSYLNK